MSFFKKFMMPEAIKFEKPCVLAVRILSMKEVESKFGKNTLYICEGIYADENSERQGKFSFFDSYKALRTQLENLQVEEEDYIIIRYLGVRKSQNGFNFKSFYVEKTEDDFFYEYFE